MSDEAMRSAAGGALCPSAQPDMEGPIVLGLMADVDGVRQVQYLNERLPFTGEIAAQAGEAPTRFLRIAARCEESKCSHFDGETCRLATRIATMLEPVVDKLPPCSIRRDCRWYAQEGLPACLRCPQVVTESAGISEQFRKAALGV
jgi:hypothetical protein